MPLLFIHIGVAKEELMIFTMEEIYEFISNAKDNVIKELKNSRRKICLKHGKN